jgi:hypothetical protein
MRRLLAFALLIVAAPSLFAQDLPAYRKRLLGVYDAQTGDPVEGAEVSDALAKLTALTTATGTVTLSFLPEGATLVRIKKVGYAAQTLTVAISPADTLPLTVLLTRSNAQELPAVVTKDSAVKFVAPLLREFEQRRNDKSIHGQFVTEAELRKKDEVTIATIARRFMGGKVVPTPQGIILASARHMAGRDNVCPADVYINGLRQNGIVDLDHQRAIDYAGIEYYESPATTPAQYNKNNGGCGVLLLWYRER